MSDESELRDWAVRGRDMAHEELPQYAAPSGREEFRDYLVDLYDQEHAYVEQRRRCVEAALAGYYQTWRDARLQAAKALAVATDAAIAAQHGPVRVRRLEAGR